MREATTQAVIERMLEERPVLSTRDVALAASVSRQMAQKLLKALVADGRLTIEGKARAARYIRARREVPRGDRRRDAGPAGWIARSLPSVEGEVDDSPRRRREDRGESVDDSAGSDAVDVSPPVVDSAATSVDVPSFRHSAQLWDSGSPYACPAPLPAPPVLDVASAGAQYRLSARILLDGVDAPHVILDFTGVMLVEDEFLEEVFQCWAPRHPDTCLETVNVPAAFRARVSAFVTPRVG